MKLVLLQLYSHLNIPVCHFELEIMNHFTDSIPIVRLDLLSNWNLNQDFQSVTFMSFQMVTLSDYVNTVP